MTKVKAGLTDVRETSSTNLVFKTRFTPSVAVLSIPPIVCSILLFSFAYDSFNKLSPNDSSRIPFAGVPALLGLTLIAIVIVVLRQYLNREVIIKGRSLIYKDYQSELHLEIPRMAYSPPGSGLFKMMMFSDGITFVQLPEVFLGKKEFEGLENAINERRFKQSMMGQQTYSI